MRIDRTLRAFLSALAFYAKGLKDTCYPSVARLAHDIGCCPGHVRRQIRKATALGLISLVPVAWNRCRRVFKLLWKPDLAVDPRDRNGGRALPERPGPAPYPSARDRRLTRAPKGAQGSSKMEEKNAVGVVPQEGGTPPAETEQEPPTPEAVREAIAQGRAAARVSPPAPEITPQATLRKAGPSPEALARVVAELEAHKAARIAREAPQATASPAPAPEAPSAAPAPRGWAATLAKVFRG